MVEEEKREDKFSEIAGETNIYSGTVYNKHIYIYKCFVS